MERSQVKLKGNWFLEKHIFLQAAWISDIVLGCYIQNSVNVSLWNQPDKKVFSHKYLLNEVVNNFVLSGKYKSRNLFGNVTKFDILKITWVVLRNINFWSTLFHSLINNVIAWCVVFIPRHISIFWKHVLVFFQTKT